VSDRVPLPPDPAGLGLRPIDRALMDTVGLAARRSPRRRAILRYHELAERLQRMLNAVEPESYIQPHAHSAPHKVEAFVVLRGRGLVVRFDRAGQIAEAIALAAGGPVHGVEIPPGAWHTVLSLEPGSVFYEVKDGPYDPATDKVFAPWAPPESDGPAARAYLAGLRHQLRLPHLAGPISARNEMDEADDDLL